MIVKQLKEALKNVDENNPVKIEVCYGDTCYDIEIKSEPDTFVLSIANRQDY